MKASDLVLLQSAITATADWKTAAEAEGIILNEIVATFPDGSQVRFLWDQTEGEYIVSL